MCVVWSTNKYISPKMAKLFPVFLSIHLVNKSVFFKLFLYINNEQNISISQRQNEDLESIADLSHNGVLCREKKPAWPFLIKLTNFIMPH